MMGNNYENQFMNLSLRQHKSVFNRYEREVYIYESVSLRYGGLLPKIKKS